MTRPRFTDQISLGNIIQIVGMLAVVSTAFLYVQFQTTANAEEARKATANRSEIRGKIRNLEVGEAAQSERMIALQSDIRDIKSTLVRSNQLLLQLIQSRSIE